MKTSGAILMVVAFGFTSCKTNTSSHADAALESAHIQGQITCWNIYDPAGSAPKLKFVATSDSAIKGLSFRQDESDKDWLKKSYAGPFAGVLNDSNHSPYKGTNDYWLVGNELRLILPAKLDEHSVKTTVIHGDRETAVLEISATLYNPDGGGGNYYQRMHCTGGR
jgi:hypothetical protein